MPARCRYRLTLKALTYSLRFKESRKPSSRQTNSQSQKKSCWNPEGEVHRCLELSPEVVHGLGEVHVDADLGFRV